MERIKETVELMNDFKAKYQNHPKQCYKCKYYIEKYKDDWTLRFYGYGKVKYRPACGYCNTYGFVSINPAPLCKYYEEKQRVESEK